MASINPDEEHYNQQKTSPPTDEGLKIEWPEDPGIVGGVNTPQQPFPLEAMGPGLRDLCVSIQRISGCNPASAAQLVLGSTGICAQSDTDVRLPWARKPSSSSPVSLFIGGLVKSGGRKSAGFDPVFAPHAEADRQIRRLHDQAAAEHKAWVASKKGAGQRNGAAQEPEPPQPLAYSPRMLRTDSTVEAIMRDLDRGRGCMALANAEGGAMIENWSNDRRKAGSVAAYNALWSGESQTLDRTGNGGTSRYLDGSQRFSMILLAQVDYRSWFFDRATTNGFAARMLIQCGDGWDSDDRLAITAQVTPEDDTAVLAFQGLISDWRQELDDGAHLARDPEDPPARRRVLQFAPEGRQTARAFEEECVARAAELLDCPWTESFLDRGPEHACRLAAVLFTYRQRAGYAPDGDVIDAQALEDGITLARWFGDEMARAAPEAGADEVAQVAAALSRALWEASVDPEGSGRNKNGTISISVATKTRRGIRTLGRRPELRTKVLQALVDAGHMVFPDPGKLTQCWVNPHLAGLYQPEG